MFKLLLEMGIVMGLLALVACNTVEGVGKDLESAGEAISGTSRDVRNKQN